MEKYVLVLDDNPSDLLISSTLVESTDRVVVRANHPKQALELLSKYPFSLFVIDLQMPEIPGFEVIKRIRSVDKFKVTPVLVMSARGESKDVMMAVAAGANDYAVKPLDHMVFEGKVNTLLGAPGTWQEYALAGDSPDSKAQVIQSMKIVSISEVGMTVETNMASAKGDIFEIQAGLLSKWSLSVMRVKVNDVISFQNRNLLKLEFVATKETDRKQIRLLCRDLWRQKQAL